MQYAAPDRFFKVILGIFIPFSRLQFFSRSMSKIYPQVSLLNRQKQVKKTVSLDSTDQEDINRQTDRETDTHSHIQGSQSEKSRKKHAFACHFMGHLHALHAIFQLFAYFACQNTIYLLP